ncbi:DHH family phosphoesterase [Candidatus Gottesmanbacteria bacterium]|nr:DHH family phosphoesterase [Candidatus Gottesmanbacteria bacterium]
MDLQKDITKVKELLEPAKSVLVVTHENPSADSVGAALATYLGLIGIGKIVTVACPSAMTVSLSSFVGVNKFVSELGKKNFVISLDYVDGAIEKVSYNIEGDKFHLVIEPRPSHEFDEKKVHFSNQGTAADVIMTIDTIHLGGLKHLYETEKDLFASKPIINIDRHANNAHFGAVNIVDSSASSTAEIVAQVLSGVGVKLTVDIANNLLNALYEATTNFTTPTISAAAFDVAAVCARAGAKKFVSTIASEEVPGGEAAGEAASFGAHPTVVPAPMPIPVAPAPVAPAAPSQNQPLPGSVKKAPEDWLKPKIFKSTSIS